MDICFIMYPWDAVDPKKDSTLRIIHEAVKRGHTVSITTPKNLTIRDCITMAFCETFEKTETISKNFVSFYKHAQFKKHMLPLEGFDTIFMRDNPPMDSFILNFLDSVKNNVFILNSVEGLREANNKVYTASYYDPDYNLIPATYVSKNKEYLKKVIDEHDGEKMIMKPLDGFGGSGVIVIEKSARQNINSLLDFYIDGISGGTSNYVILQEYVEGAEDGDVRVLMLNGEPLGAMRRVPPKNDPRSNFSVGGSVKKHVLGKGELKLCRRIGKKLVQDGLYFVGLDLIGEKLIEVNVMSPGGIVNINHLNKCKLQEDIINFIEDVTNYEKKLSERKVALKEQVKNA
ncbi:glutathione synthase [Chitinivibrio alkaliphilus]|uniref:Glutathione synthetase n=1 Tax=Chitinivibrio alkaliphilus ACht1 TaxID=1313304 RepID=U7D7G2_9BACT|nr:glutathione synthase [Chitinivibrio alkaliphilus]ERP31868.1 glutathione synthase [Chitinivibrio alkaliphilus ACht1]